MLPFTSIGEAEAAMGRNLTVAEAVWFQYSAGMHDFWLYAHNIVFLLLVYSVAPLPVALAELKRPKAIHKYKLQPKVHVPVADVLKCYKNVVKTFLFAVGPLQLVSFPTIKWVGIRTGLPLPSGGGGGAAGRILRGGGLLQLLAPPGAAQPLGLRSHPPGAPRVHGARGFAAPYAHWAEVLILGFPAFLGPAIAPCHILVFWLWFVLRHVEAIETHCGYVRLPLIHHRLLIEMHYAAS
ncbi:Fatty acid hydroxylase superfamily [Musa troglodytarum]|uniref:Fatty acid hydroxylase superfamily n=1 Tax=Musa troglodytarum TaxID=320322 RepID=A0A9E7FPM2_9LILI|nr:Fatty acid hydroxylase superfamily [Musa troglodytarum]